MRRRRGKLNRERFCANTRTKIIHDLDNENEDCFINEILDHGAERPFFSLEQARNAEYVNYHSCVVLSNDEHNAAHVDED